MELHLRKILLSAAILLVPAGASPAVHLGGVYVGGGYSHFGGRGPFYDPYWYGGRFYDPWFYPGFGPAFYGPGSFGYQPSRGEIKLRSASKTAGVYVNGGFAGEAGKLKQFWLDPGVYQLEVREGSQPMYSAKIYVLSGKTLTIDPRSAAEGKRP